MKALKTCKGLASISICMCYAQAANAHGIDAETLYWTAATLLQPLSLIWIALSSRFAGIRWLTLAGNVLSYLVVWLACIYWLPMDGLAVTYIFGAALVANNLVSYYLAGKVSKA
jgi:hypothetical protein